MDQATYNMRVKAFLEDMNRKGVDPETAAELLEQVGQTDKSAATMRIAYKEAPTLPSGELPYLRAAFKAAGIDQGSDAAEQFEDLWEAEGLAVALGQIARYKAEAGLNRDGLRSDTGRLLGAPIRDPKTGRPLY